MPKLIKIPACPGAPLSRRSRRQTREFQIALVTPLFGGGADAGEPDESLSIRGTSIRGQLQFWWRATRGAACADRGELFAHHAEVWGTTRKASPVEIDIRDVAASSPRPCAKYSARNDGKLQPRWERPFDDRILPYALFPFQGQLSRDRRTIEKNPAHFIETASFTLRIRYPEALRPDVEAAVWAWVNFGGLGARTRRGCGALLCRELAPKDANHLERWFGAGRTDGVGGARDWPTLPSRLLAGRELETPVHAWKKVVGLLQEFRQGVEIARNPGQQTNRPGRSRYPEPETIRRVTGRRSTLHRRLPDIPDDAFPRAEFGLPMVFHFQGQGEPSPDAVLYPSNAERMASPLILKPLGLASGKAVPLIVQLVTSLLPGVELKQGSQSWTFPASTVRDPRLASYGNSPISSSKSGSVLEAFLLHAGQSGHGFREVRR